MGSCSECGASWGAGPSYLEVGLRRQRGRRYSSSSEWWELWDLAPLDLGVLVAIVLAVGGIVYLAITRL
jgi:hypothetical protein